MSRSNPRVATPARESIIASDQGSSTRRVRVLAKLLDNSIGIPGTGWKIGFDPIVGLIPGIGDLIGAVLSGYIILEAARAEVPTYMLLRMLVNVGVDTLLGSIPAVGDVFDAAWKSKTKNVALLERHLSGDRAAIAREKRGTIAVIALTVVALVLIIGAGLALGIYVARLLWGLGTR